MPSPQEVIDHMLQHDAFSRWLGVEVLEISLGQARIRAKMRAEMANGFGIIHGGVAYALADSALAFASNGQGRLSVALQNSARYAKAAHPGDILTAEASELVSGHKTATYQIIVKNQDAETVLLVQGTVYRTSRSVIASD